MVSICLLGYMLLLVYIYICIVGACLMADWAANKLDTKKLKKKNIEPTQIERKCVPSALQDFRI